MSENLDTSSTPINSGDEPTGIAEQSVESNESTFMQGFRQHLTAYASNMRKVDERRQEGIALDEELHKRQELGVADYSKLDQLALAIEEIADARKIVSSCESNINQITPEPLKRIFAAAPFKVEMEGYKITVTAVEADLNGNYRIRLKAE